MQGKDEVPAGKEDKDGSWLPQVLDVLEQGLQQAGGTLLNNFIS